MGSIEKDINEILRRIAEYRNMYEDVLSFTSSWHPGHVSQFRQPPSRAASVDSRLSVRTSPSELEAKRQIEIQQRAEQLEIDLEVEKTKKIPKSSLGRGSPRPFGDSAASIGSRDKS